MNIGAGALYVLAAKSTPQEVRREAQDATGRTNDLDQGQELVREIKTKRHCKSQDLPASARLFKAGDWLLTSKPAGQSSPNIMGGGARYWTGAG